MSDAATPLRRRLNTIAALLGEADRLMVEAQHDSLKAEVIRAKGELGIARNHLSQSRVEPDPSMFAIVDMDIAFATRRLKEVAIPIRTRGPEAPLLG